MIPASMAKVKGRKYYYEPYVIFVAPEYDAASKTLVKDSDWKGQGVAPENLDRRIVLSFSACNGMTTITDERYGKVGDDCYPLFCEVHAWRLYRDANGKLKAGMIMLAEFKNKEQTVDEKDRPIMPEAVAALGAFGKYMEARGIKDNTADVTRFHFGFVEWNNALAIGRLPDHASKLPPPPPEQQRMGQPLEKSLDS